MRSHYGDFVSVMEKRDVEDGSNNMNNTIPYHARENSLPFSYGQIKQTSTPLKNGRVGGLGGGSTCYDVGRERSRDVCYNLNSDSERERDRYGYSKAGTDDEDNGNMIKAQPRLSSPLLVRKTLNSRSPTRSASTTNTIANTYHYNYGGSDVGLNGLNSSSTNNKSNTLRSRTPTRNEFEELLRERREKVYNEYRSTTHDSSRTDSFLSRRTPEPPQRQLSSLTRYSTTNGHGNVDHSQIRSRNPASQSKYNYDIEFNLNLDDEWQPQRQQTQQFQSQLYSGTNNNMHRTNNDSNYMDNNNTLRRLSNNTLSMDVVDEPVVMRGGDTAFVERNYHTISSTYPLHRERPPLEVTTATYDSRRSLPQHAWQQQKLQQQQQQHRTDYTAYGNVNAAGYGNANNNNNSSPIYATTAKQVATTIRSNNIEPEMSIADYTTSKATASSAMASPSAVTPLAARPETPAFPVTPRSIHAYGSNNGYNSPSAHPHSPVLTRIDRSNSQLPDVQNYSSETIYQTINRPRLNSSFSTANSEPQEVAAHLVKFAKDSSKFWYKATLTREEAISLLLHAQPGTFLVRDSTTYKNAYGLVLRVPQTPPYNATGKPDELVRHFLIEPTTRGVRLKGCANEPVFTSLSAFVYEHSINKLGLPCLLRIPEQDLVPLLEPTPAQKQLLTQGAACNVLWLFSCETESLTGEEAIRKAIRQLYAQKSLPTPTEVHFKVSQQGITLTDNTRKKFFRKHYSADIISYCAVDPDHRLWTVEPQTDNAQSALKKTIFAFVARRSASSKDNQCHVFCDLDISQPASAIVSFANKTLPTEKQRNFVL